MTYRYGKKHALKKASMNADGQRREHATRLAAERATVADLEKMRERLAQELQDKPGAGQALQNIDSQISIHAGEIAKLEVMLIADKHGTL